jgi:hypothetical protein
MHESHSVSKGSKKLEKIFMMATISAVMAIAIWFLVDLWRNTVALSRVVNDPSVAEFYGDSIWVDSIGMVGFLGLDVLLCLRMKRKRREHSIDENQEAKHR